VPVSTNRIASTSGPFDVPVGRGGAAGKDRWGPYALALAGTLGALALSDALAARMVHVPFIFCYVAVALSALYGGLGPALLSTAVAIVGISYLILPPTHTLHVERPADILSVIAFTAVSVAISSLTNSLRRALRRSAWLAKLHEAQTIELTNSNLELQRAAHDLDELRRQAEIARAAAESASAAKSRLLGMVSHELRTPINAALGYADLLLTGLGGPLTDQATGYVLRIRNANRDLARLVSDLLDVMKAESGRLTVVHERGDITEPVEQALALVRPHADGRGVMLHYNALPKNASPSYLGDADRLRQIVLNLMTNATKFTDPGGCVTVTCGTTDRPSPDATLRGDRSWAFVRVADTGCGIPADQLELIFEPFVQAPAGERRGGTGLGLAISRYLARLMGGNVSVTSTLGAGSAFTVWLPAPADSETVTLDRDVGAVLEPLSSEP
jgi:signal transduction histidine kinase